VLWLPDRSDNPSTNKHRSRGKAAALGTKLAIQNVQTTTVRLETAKCARSRCRPSRHHQVSHMNPKAASRIIMLVMRT
jgi:hypothetical protein